MRVRFAPRALLEAQRKRAWWRDNRDTQELFDDELAETVRALAATPSLGAPYDCDLELPVRRVLMKRTANHVYFTVAVDEVVILSVWGASRGRGPRL